jgi:cation diffusion facilitator CzcD-associated flavoprotein CzcO
LIKDYVEESARKYNIDKKIKFNHRVSNANYSSSENSWTLNVQAKGESFNVKARFLSLCTGYYDYEMPLQTTIPGIDSFCGKVVHPQFWPEDLDYTDKNIVVIGSGATAVTILPVLAEKASQVTMVQRSPGYVISALTEDATEKFVRRWFSWWPAFQHWVIRTKYILMSLFFMNILARYPEKAKEGILKRIAASLPETVPIDPHFTPRYFPGQQRMCLSPNGDFYDAFKSGKANVETGEIETVTKDAIKLASGKTLHPDIIITATGLKLIFASGIKFQVDNAIVDVSKQFVWRGVMIEGLPNAATAMGYSNASWTLGADASAQLVCRIIKQMRRDGVVRVTPKMTETERSTMKPGPSRMTSTYLKLGGGAMPKPGNSGPWLPRSHYIKDIWTAWYGNIYTNLEWEKA